MVTYLFAWMSVFIHQTCGFCFSYDFQACVNKSISELRAYHNLGCYGILLLPNNRGRMDFD